MFVSMAIICILPSDHKGGILMIRIFLRVFRFLWRFSFFRLGTFHFPAGLRKLRIGIALFSYFGINKYVAITVGHCIHVGLGFFYDRAITFRAANNKGWRTLLM